MDSHQRRVLRREMERLARPVGDSWKEIATSRKPRNRNREPKTILIWLRSIGAIAILLGGAGVMQTFFLPSVIAIYLGLSLLLIDLFLEEFGTSRWVKIPIALTILTIGVLFTYAVVLRPHDILCAYRMSNGRLHVVLINGSVDDYQNIDFKIRPDFPRDFVLDAKQITSLPGVYFIDAMPFVGTAPNESISVHVDPSNPDAPKRPLVNFLRMRCDKLPAHSSIEISLALVQIPVKEDVPVGSVSKVIIDGSYQGKFRSYKLEQDIPPIPPF